jgi:hypothetical protein
MRGYFLRGLGKRLADLAQLAPVLRLLQLLLHLPDVLQEVRLASIENVRHLICMAGRGSIQSHTDFRKWVRMINRRETAFDEPILIGDGAVILKMLNES